MRIYPPYFFFIISKIFNYVKFKNQITMLIILLKTTLMKNINHIINVSIIKTVDIYVPRET